MYIKEINKLIQHDGKAGISLGFVLTVKQNKQYEYVTLYSLFK